MSKTSRGFTVVEILVAITIAVIVLTGLFTLVINLVNVGNRSIDQSRQTNEIQAGLGVIRDDLRLTNNFLMTSSITDNSPAGTAWNFRGSGASSRVLILKTLATSAYKTDTARLPTYLDAGGCPIGSQPAYNNILYYVRDGVLLRRVVVTPPVANMYCAGQSNAQVRTCLAPGSVGEPSNCVEKDVVIARDVTNFNIQYFTNPGDGTPFATIYDTGTNQGQLDSLSTLQITISTRKNIDGQNNEYSANIRATRSITL